MGFQLHKRVEFCMGFQLHKRILVMSLNLQVTNAMQGVLEPGINATKGQTDM